MIEPTLYTFLGGDGRTPFAEKALLAAGCTVLPPGSAKANVLILPIPALDGDLIRGGPKADVLASLLKPGMSVFGGHIQKLQPMLSAAGACGTDLKEDQGFLAANASITAEAALIALGQALPGCLCDAKILLMGWGRIGKLLLSRLMALGSDVTVAGRNPRDLALLEAMGCTAIPYDCIVDLNGFDAIVNTVPAPVLPQSAAASLREDTVLMELASFPGGFPGILREKVIKASGLPGKYAPKEAGTIIARAILRHQKGRTL